MKKILFAGVNDYILRNLLCSSFPERARQLRLQIHALVYPESYPVFREMLEREVGMTSEPQDKVRLSDWKLPHLERLAFRSSLYRASRVGNHTYKAYRRQAWEEGGKGVAARLKLELAFLAGRVGGMMGADEKLTREYFAGLTRTPYVQEVCIPRLKSLASDLLVSASPETFYDVPWLLAAGVLGIPRLIWIRSWDNMTSKITSLPDAETCVVWSELMARELCQYFPSYADRRIVKIGAPQFDGHCHPANIIPREEFCDRVGLNPRVPFILYCTGGPHVVTNEHLLIQDLQRIVSRTPTSSRPQILVRLHPYTWNTDMRAYEHLRDMCLWPRPEQSAMMAGGSTTGLIDDYRIMLSSFYHQAVNINVASTVTLDSIVLDKPVVNIAYDGPQKVHPLISARRIYRYDHYRHVVDSGAVSVSYSFAELRHHVEQALSCPDLQRRQRQELVRLECGDVDGRAGERLADVLAASAGEVSTESTQQARECSVA